MAAPRSFHPAALRSLHDAALTVSARLAPVLERVRERTTLPTEGTSADVRAVEPSAERQDRADEAVRRSA